MQRPWGKQQLKCRLGHTLWVPGTLGRSLGFAPSVPRPAPAVTHTPRVEDGLYERAQWEQKDSSSQSRPVVLVWMGKVDLGPVSGG